VKEKAKAFFIIKSASGGGSPSGQGFVEVSVGLPPVHICGGEVDDIRFIGLVERGQRAPVRNSATFLHAPTDAQEVTPPVPFRAQLKIQDRRLIGRVLRDRARRILSASGPDLKLTGKIIYEFLTR
jgi:hypothetical protein